MKPMLRRSSSAVYSIHYHIVWCPKYRHPVLLAKVKERVEQLIRDTAHHKNWWVEELEIMPDHIHLFISAPPTVSPTAIVRILKGKTAYHLFREFPYLARQYFWGGHLWAPGYYVGTAGYVSTETVKRYIAGTRNRGRQTRNSSPA